MPDSVPQFDFVDGSLVRVDTRTASQTPQTNNDSEVPSFDIVDGEIVGSPSSSAPEPQDSSRSLLQTLLSPLVPATAPARGAAAFIQDEPLERGDTAVESPASSGLVLSPNAERFSRRIAEALPEIPAGLLDLVAGGAMRLDQARGGSSYEGMEVEDLATARAAEWIRDMRETVFPENPHLEHSFVLDTVPSAMGSFGAFIAGGAAVGAARGSALLFSLLSAGGLGYSQTYREAKAMGASEEDAQIAAEWGVVPGAIQAFPVMRALGRFDRAASGKLRGDLRRQIREGFKGGIEEFILESAGETGFNVIAQNWYDEDREYFDNVLEGGAAGGIAGFMASFVMTGLGASAGRQRILQTAEQNQIMPDLNLSTDELGQQVQNVLKARMELGPIAVEALAKGDLIEFTQSVLENSESREDAIASLESLIGPGADALVSQIESGEVEADTEGRIALAREAEAEREAVEKTVDLVDTSEEGTPSTPQEALQELTEARQDEGVQEATQEAQEANDQVQQAAEQSPILSAEEMSLFEAEMQLEQVEAGRETIDLIDTAMEDFSSIVNDTDIDLTVSENAWLEHQFRQSIGASTTVQPGSRQETQLRERAASDARARRMDASSRRKVDKLQERIERMQDKHRDQIQSNRAKADLKLAERRLRAEERLGREVERRRQEIQRRFDERGDLRSAIAQLEQLVEQLPAEVRSQFRGFESLSNIVGPEAQQAFLDRASRRVADLTEGFTLRGDRQALSDMIRRNAPARGAKERLGRRLDVATQRTFRKIREFSGLSRDVVDSRKADVLKRMDDQTLTPEQRDSLIEEHFLLDVFGAKTNARETMGFTADQMRRALDEAAYIETEGRSRKQEELERRREETDRLIESSVRAVSPDGEVPGPQQIRLLEQQRNTGVWRSFVRGIRGEVTRAQSFEWLLDSITMDDSAQLQGQLQEFFVRQFVANNQKFETISAEQTAVENMLLSIYGENKFSKVADRMNQHMVVTQDSGVHLAKADGSMEQIPLSVNQGISFYMQLQQPALESTFEQMGVTAQTRSELEALIGPEGVQMANGLMERYALLYEQVNEVYNRVDGVDLPRVEGYSPIRRTSQPEVGGAEFLQNYDMRATVRNQSMMERTGSTETLVFDDAFTVFSQYSSQMAHYIHMADWARDARAVFFNNQFSGAVDAIHGRQVTETVQTYVNDIINGGASDMAKLGLLDKLRGNVTTASLGIKPSIFLKQLTSIPAFMNEMPTADYARLTAEFWRDPVGNAKFLINNSSYIRERIDAGYDRDVRTAITQMEASNLKAIKTLRQASMFMVRMGDVGAIALGGWPVYQYHYNKRLADGLSPEQAQSEAMTQFEMSVNRSQQSSRLDSMSHWQRANSWSRLFTMYMTAPASYFRLELAAFRNLQKGRISKKQFAKQFAIFHFVLPNMFQLASNAFMIPFFVEDEDRAAEFWRRHLRASIVGSFNGFLFWGDMIESVADVMSGSPIYFGRQSIPVNDMLSDITLGAAEIGSAVWDIFSGEDDIDNSISRIGEGSTPLIESFTGLPVRTFAEFYNGLELVYDGEVEEAMYKFLGFSDYARAARR